MAQQNKTSLDITPFVRRAYLLSQAIALCTMDQFSSVEFLSNEIKLTAENVVNRRDGAYHSLGRVIFFMRPDSFVLKIANDCRDAKCQGDAYGNYQRAVAEGRLVACAEILWQHVTVG